MTTITEFGFDADTSGLVKAEAALDSMATSTERADAAAKRFKTSSASAASALEAAGAKARQAAQGIAEAAQAQERFAVVARSSAYDALRSGLDDVYANSKRYEAAVSTLQAEVSSGAITQGEANRVLAMAEARYLGVASATQQLAAATDRIDFDFDNVRMGLDGVYANSKRYEQVVMTTKRAVSSGAVSQAEANRILALAESQYLATGNAAQVMGGHMRSSGAQTANLAAQFNDIGVMLAAGQNPLMLAVQQGTQINQVFASMGGGKTALRGVATALVSMVNPLSLVTIGAIAGGAALIQWIASAASAGDEAETMEDAIDALRQQIDEYEASAEAARRSTSDMADEFGAGATRIRAILTTIEEVDFSRAEDAAVGFARRVVGELLKVEGDARTAKIRVQQELAGIFNVDDALGGELEARRMAQQLFGPLIGEMETLRASANLDDAIPAAQQLFRTFEDMAMASGDLNKEEEAFLANLGEAIVEMQRLKQLGEGMNEDEKERLRLAGELADQERMLGEQIEAHARAKAMAMVEAEKELATLGANVALQEMIARYGEDSATVARLRAQQEREIYAESLKTRDITQDMKDELLAAYDAGRRLADLDMASGVNSAASAARALATELGISLALAQRLAAAGATPKAAPVYDPRDPRYKPEPAAAGTMREIQDQGYGTVSPFDPERMAAEEKARIAAAKKLAGGGGGKKKTDAQKSAEDYKDDLEALVKSLETERETLDNWYLDSQKIIEDQRAAEILGKEAHNEAKIRLDEEYFERLRDLEMSSGNSRLAQTEQIFGALANVAAAGGKKMAKAAATFGAIEATVNAYRAAVAALATPGISIAGRFAAYAAVLATGLQGVAAIRSAGGGGGGGGSGAAGTSAAPDAGPSPQRVTLDFNGAPSWVEAMFDDILTRIQRESEVGTIFSVAR